MSEEVILRAGPALPDDVRVRDSGHCGMISLRGDHAEIATAVAQITGLDVPGVNRVLTRGDYSVVWMAPDELLLLLPHADTVTALASLATALAFVHHLATEVSDSRAAFVLEGVYAREILGKLAPVDLHPEAFRPGMVRRTRLGQIAAAIWCMADDRWMVLCFRSVRDYARELLLRSAQDGQVGFYSVLDREGVEGCLPE